MAAVILALGASLPVYAAPHELQLTDLQPQYASQLCWAAADAIAVNSFYTDANVCLTDKTTPFNVHPPGRTSQSTEFALSWTGATSSADSGKLTFDQAWMTNQLPGCVGYIQSCNRPGTSILPGLIFKTKTNDEHLSWEEATQQINNGHPFLFQWKYKSGGSHELVVIGYEESGQKLIIWDPLPVPKMLPSHVDACDPDPDSKPDPAQPLSMQNPPQLTAKQKKKHTKRIDFTSYSAPVSDMGAPATHALDQYDLRLSGAAVAAVEPTHVPNQPSVRKNLLTVRQVSGMHLYEARQQPLPSKLVKVMFEEPAHLSSSSSETTGIPFPIVGLELEDLRGIDMNPLELLTRKTTAVLFPVESHGEVIDSFLMLLSDGKWHRGGYSNTEITQLLVDARNNYAKKENLSLDTFYLVSIPGRAAFFAAHGRDKQAVLIPASSDPSINAEAEVAVPAVEMLKQVSAAIRRDDEAAANSQAASKSPRPSER
jgi:hypothetical protein